MKSTTAHLWLLFFLVFVSCSTDASKSLSKPNIIFIFADDLTYEAVHDASFGRHQDEVNTPHLDRLMTMGTTFTHVYNMGGWNGAICVASRSMLISGRYLWNAQEISRAWNDSDTVAWDQTWGRLLSEAGYHTYMSGKWHVTAPADYVFKTVWHIRPGMPQDTWGNGGGRTVAEAIQQGEDLATAMPLGYNRPLSPSDIRWSPSDTSMGGYWAGGKHWSEVLREDALDFIDMANTGDEPFFIYLAFNAPHDPRQSPQSFLDLYPVEEIHVPDNFLSEHPEYDRIGLGPGLRDEALAPFPRTEYAVQKHRQEYYALISHMDEQIGTILDALESAGIMDQTYIVFTADHGLAVGHHGLIGKQNMYDHSMRVPFIVCGPDVPRNEFRSQKIYLQDVMPTVLEWAGAEVPEYVNFHSLREMIGNPEVRSPYEAIYGAYMGIHRMVVKDGFKLITYPTIDKVLLFDLNEDPNEMRNLAGQPAYHDKLNELRLHLEQIQRAMDDPLALAQ